MMENKRYVLNRDYRHLKIRTKPYDTGVLMTNDYGNWLHLSKKEYQKYVFRDLDDDLFAKLEANLMILTDKNMNDIPHRINDYYWYIENGTSLHILVPTLRCNFTCKYCYAFRAPLESHQKDMDEKTLDTTIDFIFKSPAPSYVVEFTGGEPLLKFDIVKRGILRAEKLAKEKGKHVVFSIVTNGSYLTEDMIPFLKEHNVGLCLSLDGPQELHDKNRRFTKDGTGTYQKTVETIKMLKKHDFPSINAIPVILRDSLDEWKEIVDEYVSLGFNSVRFKYVSRFGFASQAWESMSYSADEFLDKWRKVMDYLIELNKQGISVIENLAEIILHKIVTGLNSGYAELQIPCGAGIGQMVYDYDGSIYTCDEGRTMEEFKIGSVFESSYMDVINNPITKTMENMSNLTTYHCDSECVWFSFCGICPLEIYNTEKGFITNMPSNYRHKIHQGMFEYIMDKVLHDKEARDILYKWPFVTKGNVDTLPDDTNKNPFKEDAKKETIGENTLQDKTVTS